MELIADVVESVGDSIEAAVDDDAEILDAGLAFAVADLVTRQSIATMI